MNSKPKKKKRALPADVNSIQQKQLTRRELEIVKLHMEGKNRKDIARILKVAVSTIDTHTHSIHMKTGTRDVSGVIRYGYMHRLGEF